MAAAKPAVAWASWATPGRGPEFRFAGRRHSSGRRLAHRIRARLTRGRGGL